MVEFGDLNKTIILPTKPKKLLEDTPFEIGEKWAGKRIRTQDMFVEFGGPKVKVAAELIRFHEDANEIKDGRVEIWGPDIDELDEGSAYSFAEIVSYSGSKVKDIGIGYFEKNIALFHDFIEGIMHLNMRNLIWIRLHKTLSNRGVYFEHIARAIIGQLKTHNPQIEKIEIKFIIDEAQKLREPIGMLSDEGFEIWKQRNLRALELNDDDVKQFFGCRACRYYTPNHACIITPNNFGTCGVINWNAVKTSIKNDTMGDFFEIDKGDKLDDLYGRYSGIDTKIKDLTNNLVSEINLYSAIKNPQTSCGCFEALIFHIPEIDALGIAEYYYKGITPLGIKFSTVIKNYNRNIQTLGYRGIALKSFMDNKLVQGDGGWKRIVWINKKLKQNILNWIPKDLKDKIATEQDVKSIKDLQKWIDMQNHPLKTQKWDGRTWISKK